MYRKSTRGFNITKHGHDASVVKPIKNKSHVDSTYSEEAISEQGELCEIDTLTNVLTVVVTTLWYYVGGRQVIQSVLEVDLVSH